MPRPTNAREMIFDNMIFPDAVLLAAKNFAKAKPYRGSDAEKLAKFQVCATELGAALGIAHAIAVQLDPASPAAKFIPAGSASAIVLDKYSVVSLFHLVHRFKKNRSMDAQKFALNLFKRAFPRSFASAQTDGLFLRRAE